MAAIVTNIIQNSLSGLVAGAVTTVGGYAGDAVSGVGNLIEQKGKSVGDGIAKSFDSLGQGIASYGTSARNATAANLPTTVVPTKKIGKGGKPNSGTKALPAAGTAKKALPAAPERKLLTAPPAKDPKPASKGTYATSVAPFKAANPPKSSYAGSTVSVATNKTAKAGGNYPRSGASVASTAKPVSRSTPSRPTKKVSPQKQSLPGYKGPNNASMALPTPGNKKPVSVGGNPGGNQNTVGGYSGPLNLGSIAGAGSAKAKSSTPKPPSSVVGSTGGYSAKPKVGGYEGPLSLGGLS